jgi:hypothetical protein
MASDRQVITWLRKTRGPVKGAHRADVGKAALHPEVAKVQEDLRWLGIEQKFDFVWSDDGSGVEEDAPRVIHLLRTLTHADDAPESVHRAADRVVALDLGGVVRHELGHALLFLRPAAARTPSFRRLFGDVGVTYRVGSAVDEVLRRMKRGGLSNPRYRHVVSLYAAAHPHERFAEAVRVALAYRAHEDELATWTRQHDVAPEVLEQLIWAARWLKSYG